MAKSLEKTVNGIGILLPWKAIMLAGLACMACVLLFYNLSHSPATWHDEGLYLSLAKTIASDGVYAVRNSDGYQTYGVTQSVGAPLILPIALSFKLFGVGLLQARIVMAAFGLIVLILIYRSGRALFGARTAIVAVVLLLGSGTSFLYASRQTMGEVPALSFFLGGWLIWARGVRTRQRWVYLAAGVLIGLAMITKPQYVLVGYGTLALLSALDLFYYKQGHVKALVVVSVVAAACMAIWLGWQILYFGPATFWADTNKVRELAGTTTGFHPQWTVEALQYLLGPGSDHFYFFWGLPALVYACILCARRSQESSILAFLLLFTILWFGTFIFWTVPWWRYALTPIFVSCLFVAKLWHDLTEGFRLAWRDLDTELRQERISRAVLRLAALTMLALMIAEPIQKAVRLNVLGHNDAQRQVALFLDKAITQDKTIETWERELTMLTNHTYHFPEQSFLIQTHAATYLNQTRDYMLGASYFRQHGAAYLIIGKFARSAGAYDMQFLIHSSCLLTTVGEGEDRYDVYRLQNVLETHAASEDEQIAPCSDTSK